MKFEILNGPEDGKIIEIDKEKVTFGRWPDRDIKFLYAKKVTRPHGEIYKKSNAAFIADIGKEGKGSLHGTIIKRGEEKIKIKGNKAEIKPGDIIIVGKNIWLRYLG